MNPLELWGGVECTVNRVGDRFFDQVRRTGHHDRVEDIALLASTGVRAVRYPVVWERVAPDGLARADWSWTDDRLARLRAHGIRPIAGLVHHGSGPACTHLLDPDFPRLLGEYARAVAQRYPWIDSYTPVNEPLTTARFSALYGHWYPHRTDPASFVTALLNEVRGTIVAMAAIRDINPAAGLVQTEDAGRTYSTPRLARQATHENHRRWLTFDLLTGRVTDGHPLWTWLLRVGADPACLEWIAANACAPDVVGLNYYLTSDRYLDEHLDRYPVWTHGGNGVDRYADVEAVRAHEAGLAGHEHVLREAWDRYRLPVAITEVHAGATREEQLRWTTRAWTAAERAREAGADVRAVTLWAMFGSYDWNSLCVRCDGVFEPGAFDTRSNPPRRTAVASLGQTLVESRVLDPMVFQPGWWERPSRFLWPPRADGAGSTAQCAVRNERPLVIVGARGTLGRALVRACARRGLPHVALGRDLLDLTDPAAIRSVLDDLRPWAVVNAAGYVRVDDAEGDADACLRVNTDAAGCLAERCAAAGARFVTFSSDLVFDGDLRRPYVETDRPSPLNVYGISKLEAECRVRELHPRGLIIRTSAFFGPEDDFNFVALALRSLSEGRPFSAADDAVVSPTYVPDLVEATLDLLIDAESGVWHLANPGEITWAAFGRAAAALAGLDPALIVGVPTAALNLRAPRPAYSALASEHGAILPPLADALSRYTTAVAGRSAAVERLTATP
ncbi:MAG: dTDP-4-dehydrorhamnose reductase [Acidobacteriota bacterium]|jgi:dTDP-4-dehydrorhamnose reductase